jgi:hypothetical protein
MKHDPVVSPWLKCVGVASMEPREVRRVSLGTGTESGQRSLGALVGTNLGKLPLGIPSGSQTWLGNPLSIAITCYRWTL